MENEQKPLGVIDALANGFILVAQRPWILLIPLLFDLLLWLQPPISAKPVFDQLLAVTNDPLMQAQLTPEMQEAFKTMQEGIQTAGKQFDVLVVAAWSALGMPSIEGSTVVPADETRAPWFVIDNSVALLGCSVVLAVIGVFVSSVYLEVMARGVRQDGNNWVAFAPRVIRSYLNLLMLALFLVIGFILLMVPVSIGASFLSLLSQGLASFLIILMSLLIVWSGLYLAFALPAIFVSGSNPIQAILNSIMIFRFNLGPAMGLVLLIYIIQMGFSIIWQQLLSGPGGIIFNVIANAFIGSGLTAALMLFYQDRLMGLMRLRARFAQQHPVAKG